MLENELSGLRELGRTWRVEMDGLPCSGVVPEWLHLRKDPVEPMRSVTLPVARWVCGSDMEQESDSNAVNSEEDEMGGSDDWDGIIPQEEVDLSDAEDFDAIMQSNQ